MTAATMTAPAWLTEIPEAALLSGYVDEVTAEAAARVRRALVTDKLAALDTALTGAVADPLVTPDAMIAAATDLLGWRLIAEKLPPVPVVSGHRHVQVLRRMFAASLDALAAPIDLPRFVVETLHFSDEHIGVHKLNLGGPAPAVFARSGGQPHDPNDDRPPKPLDVDLAAVAAVETALAAGVALHNEIEAILNLTDPAEMPQRVVDAKALLYEGFPDWLAARGRAAEAVRAADEARLGSNLAHRCAVNGGAALASLPGIRCTPTRRPDGHLQPPTAWTLRGELGSDTYRLLEPTWSTQ